MERKVEVSRTNSIVGQFEKSVIVGKSRGKSRDCIEFSNLPPFASTLVPSLSHHAIKMTVVDKDLADFGTKNLVTSVAECAPPRSLSISHLVSTSHHRHHVTHPHAINIGRPLNLLRPAEQTPLVNLATLQRPVFEPFEHPYLSSTAEYDSLGPALGSSSTDTAWAPGKIDIGVDLGSLLPWLERQRRSRRCSCDGRAASAVRQPAQTLAA